MPLSDDPVKRSRQLANLRSAPPAPVGNDRARRHGGYAAVAIERMEAKAREVFDALAVDAPLRDDDGGLPAADVAVVRLLAECLCRLEDVSANVRDFGLFDSRSGDVRPAVKLERLLRSEAAGYLNALGMTPAARGRLGLDLARTAATVDAAAALSAARSESDPARRAALYRAAGVEVDDAGE